MKPIVSASGDPGITISKEGKIEEVEVDYAITVSKRAILRENVQQETIEKCSALNAGEKVTRLEIAL